MIMLRRGYGLVFGRRFYSVDTKNGVVRPLVAIVGKPNGGKSTLFNRLVGANRALVTPTPGTTRDRLYGQMRYLDHVVDVVDTGGMYQEREDFFSAEVMEQALIALDEASMVLMVVDGREALNDKDRRVARVLQKHKSKRPIVLCVNK
jgi:GTPase